MNLRFFAFAVTALLALPLPAKAVIISNFEVAFHKTATISETVQAGAAPTGKQVSKQAPEPSIFFPGWRSSNGILTNANFNLQSVQTLTTTVTGANSGFNPYIPMYNWGTGASSANLQIGAVKIPAQTLAVSANSCRSQPASGVCSDNSMSLQRSFDSAFSVAPGAFITPNISFQYSATADTTASPFTGPVTTTSTMDWSGVLSVEYQYVLHAAPSFSTSTTAKVLDIDFGSVYLDDPSSIENFSIFNGVGDRSGLGSQKLTYSGDANVFSTNWKGGHIKAGEQHDISAFFAPTALGAFAGSYDFYYYESATSQGGLIPMKVNLKGNVIARPAVEVPEPGSIALTSIAMAGLALTRRRKPV